MPEHLKKSKVPAPPDPYHRRELLPEQRPKSIEEDPAAQKIQTILEAPVIGRLMRTVIFSTAMMYAVYASRSIISRQTLT